MQEAPTSPKCEVVILTALGVEYKAVCEHLQDDIREVTHQGTVYGYGNFTEQGCTWRVAVAEIGMGGLAAAAETERALRYFHPQIALFVGVGGGLKDVTIGDVVAATKVYAYESGKITQQFQPRPEVWRASYRLEQRARVEARNEKWLARLDNSCPDPAPQVHIGALAAGEKVLASTQSGLFRLLKAIYGDALAIEMEGHGFLAAIRANQSVHALVIRGISDLIDGKSEADATGSQTAAARHAAAFAFQVLEGLQKEEQKQEEQVSEEQQLGRMKRRRDPFPPVWNVPYRYAPFFTGRDGVLAELFHQFTSTPATGTVPVQALTGLGGLGKTQTAVAYAFRYRKEYQTVIWIKAETEGDLLASFTNMIKLLELPLVNVKERESVLEGVKRWLSETADWLLILDNADDLKMVEPFLPMELPSGHLLLTTRSTAGHGLAQPLALTPLTPEEGALCLLRRASYIGWNADLGAPSLSVAARKAALDLAELMGGLPLALEQAGAYIETTGRGVAGYLKLYEQYREVIQRNQYGDILYYRSAVAFAWNLAREVVQLESPAAIELLYLCAYLAPDAIPYEMFPKDPSILGPTLGPVAAHPPALDQALSLLRRHSLIKNEVDRETDVSRIFIHRVLQEILRDDMDPETQQFWTERAVRVVGLALPEVEWSIMQAHAQTCLPLIDQWGMTFREADLIRQYVEEHK